MSSAFVPAAPRVLVAPLDWGLGHATRCIPIVECLRGQGATVFLAGSGASGRLLREAFPELPYEEIPSHTVQYARTRRGLLWKIMEQIPQLRRNIAAENEWLRDFLRRHPVDAVLADNRYGLRNPAVRSVFIGHQLALRSGLGQIADRLLSRLQYRLIGRFDACWIPDRQTPALAGSLSHPHRLPAASTRYIGSLSRFHLPVKAQHAVTNPETPDSKLQTPTRSLVVLLSGPEPQRSIWEAELLPQLAGIAGGVLLLRGLPGNTVRVEAPAGVEVAAHLPAPALAEALAGAHCVLARCGYSTVMDLAALRLRSILVPTPGQPEQEYLARHLTDVRMALCRPQKGFDLRSALAAAERFDYRFPAPSAEDLLQTAIIDLLRLCTGQ